MKTIKGINKENHPYFFNSMTNIKNFDLNLLSIKYHLKKILTVLLIR